jgi:hypothetical protein
MTAQREAAWSVLFAKYNYSHQVEEDEMGGPYSTNGGEKEGVQICGGTARGRKNGRKIKRSWVDRIKMDLV